MASDRISHCRLTLDAHTIARLTLIIPPQHPSLKDHPLRIAIPETPYSKEYIAVVDTLGGMKSWAGEPRITKASGSIDEFPNHQVEAQNAAPVTAMTDGAISWVLHPDMRDIPTEHDPEAGFQAPPMRDDDTPKPFRAYLRQVFDHVIRPHPDHVWVETMTGKALISSHWATALMCQRVRRACGSASESISRSTESTPRARMTVTTLSRSVNWRLNSMWLGLSSGSGGIVSG